MPTSKIVFKIKDTFLLQQETLNNNPGKIIIDSKFPLKNTSILAELCQIYPVLLNATNINESIKIFQNLIDSVSGFANNGKIESLFSVISNGEVVNLMRMGQSRSAFIGENLLNYFFIEVNTEEVEQILNDINELNIENPIFGIDYTYIRGELVDIGKEVVGDDWADVPDRFSDAVLTAKTKRNVDGFAIDESNNPNKMINASAKIAPQKISEFKQSEPKVQNLNKVSEIGTTKKATTALTINQKINALFFNCGIKLGTDKVNPEIKVVDLEQGWNFVNNDNLYLGLATQPILGGGLNHNDKIHGQKTLNILFGRATSANQLNGLCIGANAQTASTWFNTSSSGERKEPALASTLNKINIGDIVLLELQVSLKGGNSNLPVEIDPAMKATIQWGVHSKFIIIEAAGNGSHNLNTFHYTSALMNLSTGSSSNDAIMTGALNQSNFPILNKGLRVDHHCFGQSVKTSTSNVFFNNTSLASAIVTGLVAHLQSIAMRIKNRRLTSFEMKNILTSCIFTGQNKEPNTSSGTTNAIQSYIMQLP